MARRTAKNPASILAAVRIARTSGRDVLSGIFRFLEENQNWQLHIVQYDADFTPDLVRNAGNKGFDGIIATIPGTAGTVDALVETPLPVIFVNIQTPALATRKSPYAVILNDNAAIGHLAATTFLKNGSYSSYAYIPRTSDDWFLKRGMSFERTLAQNGKSCKWFSSTTFPDAPPDDADGLAAFLSALPKPAAVYAGSDECAIMTLEAAKEANLRIPEQMALIGTDNDEFLVRHSNPPVSSVFPGHAKMGVRAASELSKLLAGRKSPKDTIYIPPIGVMERASTKPVLPSAMLVRRTKAYIDAHACGRLDVSDVAGHLGVSRRLAELRFRQMESTSIRKAIEDRRMKEAKHLLARTKLPVTEIAKRIGLSGQNRLSHVFKARFGIAPELWRKQRNGCAGEVRHETH